MKYFYLDAAIGGDAAGENMVANWTVYPPVVSKLNYDMDYWYGDVLLESFPCWIATVAAIEKIHISRLDSPV